MRLLGLYLGILAVGLCHADIYNIQIGGNTPVWRTLNASEDVDTPESAVDVEEVTTVLNDVVEDLAYDRPGGNFGPGSDAEDLSHSYYPGYCRCINKYYCQGANNKVVRAKRAVNRSPCRGRDEVMCCLTTGPGCGVPANFPYFNPYPLYGEANYGDYPWTALIMDRNNKVIYGLGILLSWRTLITTARNIHGVRASQLKIRVGEWDLSSGDEPFVPREYPVSGLEIHPQFNSRTFQNDIAVVRLSESVDLASFPSIRSGCLARSNDFNRFTGAKCLVAGWGVQPSRRRVPSDESTKNVVKPNIINPNQQGQRRNILKEVDMEVLDGGVCQEALRRKVGDPQFILDQRSFLCAGGEGGKGLCKGDEGAALVCKDRRSDRYTVVGMSSWATTCGQPDLPNVFINIASYYEWIRNIDPQIGQ